MATAVYITARVDLQIKADTDISIATTILNSAGGAYDFSNKTDSDWEIYDHEGPDKTLIKNWGEHATEGVSYASNVVTINAAWSGISTILPAGIYYYLNTYEDDTLTNPTHKITDGTLEVL